MISIDHDELDNRNLNGNPDIDNYSDFEYDDDDNLINELNEFYSYLDVRSVLDNKEEWINAGSIPWFNIGINERKDIVNNLLQGINDEKLSIRLKSCRKLLYIFQGSFIDSKCTKHQVACIIENVELVKDCDGLHYIVKAFRSAVDFHSLIHTEFTHITEPDFIEQVNIELSSYMEMLYFMVQILRNDRNFAKDLMSLQPTLPTYLFTLVSGLRDKTAKGYPVKKLLLLLWKTLLAVLGGFKDIANVQDFIKSLFDSNFLTKKDSNNVRSNPVDFKHFFTQTSLKYPTYRPKKQSLPLNGLALAAAPTPLKSSAPNPEAGSIFDTFQPPTATGPGQEPLSINTSAPGEGLPGTPLPTPPPSPAPVGSKLKKAHFQTDQTKPFILPFSNSLDDVPTSIDEAGRLYAAYMHVPISLWQTHQIRKDFVRSLGLTNRYAEVAESEDAISDLRNNSPLDDFEPNVFAKTIKDKTNENVINQVEILERIETIYRDILPHLHNCVIVLLKLLLATLNSQTTTQHHDSNYPSKSLDEIDVTRHREITSKAVSAIILLLLKWFKVSHVMKFQWFSTLLVDSNCILLMLKMYGFQDAINLMRTQHEVEELNFSNYCFSYGSKHNGTAYEGGNFQNHQKTNSNDGIPDFETFEKPDTRTYSWRNLFSTINFMRIIQKLSKKRTHRLLLLVQYKSSAMLKRLLRISHPLLQLYILKIIKGQVPYYGRKWRQSNMKVITAIYLNCRPELRDEWLASADVDQEVEDSLPQEQSLRALVKFYNEKYYSTYALQSQQIDHINHKDKSNKTYENEVSESQNDDHISISSLDDKFDLNEFDEVMDEILGGVEGEPFDAQGLDYALKELNLNHLDRGSVAWNKLNSFLGPDYTDEISDSESVVSVDDLGFNSNIENDNDNVDNPGLNDWEHISADTLSQLPPSPNRIHQSPKTREEPFDIDSQQDLSDDKMSPPPGSPKPLPFAGGANGIGVDEVEFLYGE